MRSLSITVVLLILGLFVLMSGCSNYNNFVNLDEDVENSWSKVQSAYQRRADLIENLVETVKGAANFEKETLDQITEARASASQIKIDPSNLTPEALAQFQAAQAKMNTGLNRLLLTVENYPDLKASQNFLELQSQLESTENRINVARNNFNDTATKYNKTIRRFPASFFATMFGFGQKAQFEAQSGTENAPKVNFD